MADGGSVRNNILAIIQAVDLEYGTSVFVDYFADPRFADEVLVTDAFSVEWTLTPFADVVGVIDEISFTYGYARDLADSVTMSDALTTTTMFGRDFADAVVVTDNFAFVLDRVLALDLADSVTVTDNFAFVLNRVLALNLADAVAISDAHSAQNGPFVGFADVVTISDAGTMVHYDYAGSDYFVTPLDYVSTTRVF